VAQVCLPTESGRDFDLTLDMLRRAKLMERSVRASIFFYTPYPGTRLYERAREKGFIPPQQLAGWVHHTLRRFKAPWAPKGIDWQLELFANFYLLFGRSQLLSSRSLVQHPPDRISRQQVPPPDSVAALQS
jgi:radical SAM superfamily enzyme YgiQ (UPF0313 family)